MTRLKTARLLYAVFGIPRFADQRYLDWLYGSNPCGAEVAAEKEQGEDCLAHYAVIPQIYTDGKRQLKGALSLNTAVSDALRGQGMFTRLAEECYARCAAQGVDFIIGVANANSTPGFLRRLGFSLLCPLPVRLGMALPLKHKNVKSWRLEPGAPLPADLDALLEKIRPASVDGWQQDWNPKTLRWRLSSPATPLTVHSDGETLLVTACEQKGVPVTVILGVFGKTNVRKLVRAACAGYNTPFFITAGCGAVLLPVLPVPRCFLPSPLNLIYRPLSPAAPPAEKFRIGAFSFLDFDAY